MFVCPTVFRASILWMLSSLTYVLSRYNYDEYEEILDEPEQRDVGDNNEDSKDITDIISNKLGRHFLFSEAIL